MKTKKEALFDRLTEVRQYHLGYIEGIEKARKLIELYIKDEAKK